MAAGIARAGRFEFAGEGGRLGLRLKFGKKPALHQRGDGPRQRLRGLAEALAKRAEVGGQLAWRREGVQQRRRLVVDGEPQLRDGVN